jgi:predicted transcriptional regulator
MGRTKDELFVLAIYNAVKQIGDFESIVNKYEVGEHAGLNPKAVDAISRLLIQSNFIKKSGQEEIFLTSRGLKLAEQLLDEKKRTS